MELDVGKIGLLFVINQDVKIVYTLAVMLGSPVYLKSFPEGWGMCEFAYKC